MWIRLKDYKAPQSSRPSPIAPTLSLFSESVQQMGCKIAFLEAVNDLQNELDSNGVVAEESGRVMNWLKSKMQKICPSPEKIKEFFGGIGQKIDAKIQQSKFESLKNAWNTLKNMVNSADEDEEGQEGAEEEVPDETQQEEEPQEQGGEEEGGEVQDGAEGQEGEQGEDEEEPQQVNEGFWDSIKSGWNKLTGKGGGEEQPAPKKTATKKAGVKRTNTKKTTAKKPAAKKATGKKPAAKTTAKKATGKKTTAKGRAKAGTKKKEQPKTKWQKVLQFLKDHWKAITIIIISAIAVYFIGSKIAAMFANSDSATNASNEITGAAKSVGGAAKSSSDVIMGSAEDVSKPGLADFLKPSNMTYNGVKLNGVGKAIAQYERMVVQNGATISDAMQQSGLNEIMKNMSQSDSAVMHHRLCTLAQAAGNQKYFHLVGNLMSELISQANHLH